jgi:Flp pilus assembly protein TadB
MSADTLVAMRYAQDLTSIFDSSPGFLSGGSVKVYVIYIYICICVCVYIYIYMYCSTLVIASYVYLLVCMYVCILCVCIRDRCGKSIKID